MCKTQQPTQILGQTGLTSARGCPGQLLKGPPSLGQASANCGLVGRGLDPWLVCYPPSGRQQTEWGGAPTGQGRGLAWRREAGRPKGYCSQLRRVRVLLAARAGGITSGAPRREVEAEVGRL
eukprot:scaffold67567_cov50-Phaeocystis_antarctica.AAC.2